MSEILVVGYGNTLRRDDGIGPKIAEAVTELNLPGVRALCCHQLTPELAAPIAEARAVIFVDAERDTAAVVEPREIESGGTGQVTTHTFDPASLLSLARQVYGHCPRAWLLVVPGEDFEIGEGFSRRAREGSQKALDQIQALVAGLR